MREILFKGKRISDGKWIRGYYEEYPNGYAHIRTDEDTWYPVVPKSVGQYLGIIDKNGKKIFEGDIVTSSWGYHGLVELEPFIHALCESRISEDIEIIGNVHDGSRD